jgi:hypothetical protein
MQYIIGHMIVADPRRLQRVFVWSRSKNRWRRRASAVALLRGTNQGLFWDEVQQITGALLEDEDDMGGWPRVGAVPTLGFCRNLATVHLRFPVFQYFPCPSPSLTLQTTFGEF